MREDEYEKERRTLDHMRFTPMPMRILFDRESSRVTLITSTADIGGRLPDSSAEGVVQVIEGGAMPDTWR